MWNPNHRVGNQVNLIANLRDWRKIWSDQDPSENINTIKIIDKIEQEEYNSEQKQFKPQLKKNCTLFPIVYFRFDLQ